MSTDDKNMTTQDLIKHLRQLMPLGPQIATLVAAAADRLQELQRELTEAILERYKTVAELIKQRDEAKVTHADDLSAQMLKLISGMNAANAPQIRPEPSRLEIAAMLIAGSYACQDINPLEPSIALKDADALIAAAKEAK
jgi:hypothetical protein